MTCWELPGAGLGPTPDNMINNTKLSLLEETRSSLIRAKGRSSSESMSIRITTWWWRRSRGATPSRRSAWAKSGLPQVGGEAAGQGGEVHAVYEACGFGFGLQRQLSTLGIRCYVVSPQKLDERHERVKTDGRDAKALCLEAGSLRPGQPGGARGHPDPKQPGYFIKLAYATRRGINSRSTRDPDPSSGPASN